MSLYAVLEINNFPKSYFPNCFIKSYFMIYTAVLGETKPHLSDYMCHHSHALHKNKVLRVAMMGHPPYIIGGKDNIGGADTTLLKYLAAKMKFTSKIYVPKTYLASINMVCIHN